jgi:hypothetical protein
LSLSSPHRPRLVVSRSTCPPLSPFPYANSFVIGPAVINTHTTTRHFQSSKVHTGARNAATRENRVPPCVNPRWAPDPQWAGGWACTSHPGVLGSIPKREEPGKTGRHPVLKYRVPHGSQPRPGWAPDPRWAGGWACTSHPARSFGFNSQTRGTRENKAPPCVKVPGSSRVPH